MKKVMFVLCVGVLCLGGLLEGCSEVQQCLEGETVSSLSVNPTNSSCKTDCDCNNQVYEGRCVNGKCLGFEREQCTTKGSRRPCLPVVGDCTGTQVCQPNELRTSRWGDCACTNEQKCEDEICDGKDNDCDGLVDENLTQICYEHDGGGCQVQDGQYQCRGECQEGIKQCVAGVWTSCRGKVYPSDEICDGKDNDCDGQTDEDNPGGGGVCQTSTPGDCGRGTQVCEGGKLTCVTTSQPSTEVCDGTDNDCDGEVDEALSRPCYDTTKEGCKQEGDTYLCQGACKAGSQVCAQGKWQGCQGAIEPSQENCNNQEDDNCDGSVNENCACESGKTQACGSEIGECKKGTQTCENAKWSACQGQVSPAIEDCDGKDNDCDGKADEDLEQECFTAGQGCTRQGEYYTCQGSCKSGKRTCNEGKWSACVGEVKPSDEVCDGKDNDCNGQIDDTSGSKTCTVTGGKGVCSEGTYSCQQGKEVCVSSTQPAPEVCDGKDNDCDGSVDEDLTQDCYDGTEGCTQDAAGKYTCKGVCKVGSATCQSGKWGACQGAVKPAAETCNERDDNCDGQADEGCDCPDGKRRLCGSDTGECVQGTQTCTGGKWGNCEKAVGPTVEVCDGKDNDCDGSVDEDLKRECYNAATGCSKDAASNAYSCTGTCKIGSQSCQNGTWSSCYQMVGPMPERCDNLDNNCNGKVDDGAIPSGQTCPVPNAFGPCSQGSLVCEKGRPICKQTVQPSTEVCNGRDDDCDGLTDEKPSGTAQLCPLGQSCSTSGTCTQCSQPKDTVCQKEPVTQVCVKAAPCPQCRCGLKCFCNPATSMCKTNGCR